MTAPAFDMPQMFGLLINLKELKERKASREQQALQFAQNLGVERAAQVMRFMEGLAGTPQEAIRARAGIAATLGWEPEQVAALEAYADSIPESSAQLRERVIREGYGSLSPVQQRQVGQEAAYGALAGQTRGGAAQSGLQAWMASGGDEAAIDKLFSDNFSQAIRSGYVTRQADPFQGRMQQAAVETPGMDRVAAGIQFGGELTAGQEGSLKLQGQGLALQRIELALRQAAMKASNTTSGMMSPDNAFRALSEMTSTAAQAANPAINREMRRRAIQRYNTLARMIGQPDLVMELTDADEAPGKLSTWIAQNSGAQPIPQAQPMAMPIPQALAFPPAGQQMSQMPPNQFLQFLQTQQQIGNQLPPRMP